MELPQEPVTEEPGLAQFPPEPLIITEPGGAELVVGPGSLSQEAEVQIENSGDGIPFAEGSPFSAASSEFTVDLGGAIQIGQIRMTVPVAGGTKASASVAEKAYAVWAEPPGGTPSLVGAHVEEGKATFPVIGGGKYQVFALTAHPALMNIVSIYDPLTVPTYRQETPAWCSPTALTDLVNYHQGSWPVGGFGAVWGESSNWYLAGKAGQPFNSGYFFHWLLGAGGYSVPSDVKQSFSNGNAEVIIWNWNASLWQHLNPFEEDFGVYVDYSFADDLFDVFQAYVEYHVWGVGGTRRPIAWGSSLAGHSRIITGSNGTEYFFNNPSSGSLNDSKTWAAYRQEVMDSFTGPKIEVIDTIVLFAEPRPSNERRGVIWLFPAKDPPGSPGNIALYDGATGLPATDWWWDGSLGHENGYYYSDRRGVLPSDPVFDVQFKALNLLDEVRFGLVIRNLTGTGREYHVDVILQNENLSVLKNVASLEVYAAPTATSAVPEAGSFKLYGLQPGLYTLKYVLLLDGIYQDVKYVQFRIAPTDLQMVEIHAVLRTNAFCRKGPDPVFGDVTAYEMGTELTLLGYNPEMTWGKFEKKIGDIAVQCWISLSAVDITGGEDAPILAVPPLPLPTATEPVCTSTLDRAACNAAGGTFIVGAAPYCQCP
jgi:hypothetical protein